MMEQETINVLIPVISAVLVLIGGLVTWWLNERSKRIYEEKEKAVGALILAIRKDLIGRKPLKKTRLKPEDFKHLKAT